jgi:SAM-dependent methyltransferase/catechol 2,3-dioxygenase-like lactoylglutathione lyase family enzyme
MDKSETRIIFIATILFAITGAVGALIFSAIIHRYTENQLLIHELWSIIDVIVLTFGSLLVIRYYKKLTIGTYPTTFLYCFKMPEGSNPTGRSQVVGYCHVKPNADIGEFEVIGASFFWEDGQINIDSRVGFSSTQVRGSREKDETTCHIRFNIDSADSSKRFYRHGLLQFRLDKRTGLNDEDRDLYAGYLQSMHKDTEIQDVEVRSKGCAEPYNNGPFREDDVEATLRRRGNELLGKLQDMLRTKPQPTLWEGTTTMLSKQTNFWGHQIPSPQSVILKPELASYIDGLLSKMLGLCGIDEAAIKPFKELAKEKASVEDTRVAYETDLKIGLTGLIRRAKLSTTLYNRAKIIKGQIEPFLIGDSLLDIGCGNGMIASLVRNRFKKIQLLDVVEYLPPELDLPFKTYKEGDTISGSFDTVLLLTVLHHSNNPLELLKLAWGATNKRLIIIESVVGVHNREPGVNYELVDASDENQIAYAAFIDWFYNRVLHDDVPVPYNFTAPGKWTSVFRENNMKLVQTIHLGQDIDIGPEYHILFVLQKDEVIA